MQSSIVGDRGPSISATYYDPPEGVGQVVKGVYESPYQKQTPGDFDVEIALVSQDPTFGIRLVDVPEPKQNAELTIDDEPGKRFRVMKIEDGPVGWVTLVLELL